MQGPADPPQAPRWIAVQAAVLWLAALLCAALGILPGLGLRAGALALLAGAAFAVAALWRRAPTDEADGQADAAAREAWAVYGLVAALAIAVALHGWAALHAGVPLGYDYGFYKAAFDAYEGGVPAHAPHWIDVQFEPGLPALHAVLHGVAGLSSTDHLTGLWVVLACAVVPAAFVAARAAGGPRAGVAAALLAAVSFTQSQGYAYLYEKNVLALALFVIALFLLGRRWWAAAGVVLAGVAVVNRPTALLAILSLPLVAAPRLKAQWRGWATAGGVGMALALPVWLAWPTTFFGTGSEVAASSVAVLSTGAQGGTGTFLSGWQYLAAAAAYTPLAVVGLALAWKRPALRLAAVVTVVAGLYIVLKLPLHLRFLLMADLVALVLAGPGLAVLVPKPAWTWALATVVVLAAVPTLQETLHPATPHAFVTAAQFESIRALGDLPANATILADNLRAPYVAAESAHRSFGPGILDDPHNRTQWEAFWRGLDGAGVAAFMAPYGTDSIYVVQVDDAGPDWGQSSLHEPAFRLEGKGNGVRLWHWTGATS